MLATNGLRLGLGLGLVAVAIIGGLAAIHFWLDDRPGGTLLFDSESRIPLSHLGAPEVFELSADSANQTVTLSLPERVEQGKPLWYGVTVSYKFVGDALVAGDVANFDVLWNDDAVFGAEFRHAPNPSLESAVRWLSVDLVYGHQDHVEPSGVADLKGANFATLPSVKGGPTTIRFQYRPPASGRGRVTVLPESAVFVSRLGPPLLSVGGKASLGSRSAYLNLRVHNLGVDARGVFARVDLSFPNGSRESRSGHLVPVVGSGETKSYEWEAVDLPDRPSSVSVQFRWDGGISEEVRIFPAVGGGRRLRDYGGPIVVAAVVFTWIAVPSIAATLGDRRSSRRAS